MNTVPIEILTGIGIVWFLFCAWFLRERSIREGWNSRTVEVYDKEQNKWIRRSRKK